VNAMNEKKKVVIEVKNELKQAIRKKQMEMAREDIEMQYNKRDMDE
jgi:hypothetical protein